MHLGHQLSNGHLCPRLQGKRNSAPQALWRQSCSGYEAPGGTPGAGSPWASTETAPGIATTDFSFCEKSHPLPAYTGCHNTLWVLLSLCNAVAGRIYMYLTSLQ